MAVYPERVSITHTLSPAHLLGFTSQVNVGHALHVGRVNVILAFEAVQDAVRQFEGDRVLPGAHVIGHMGAFAAEEDAVQTGVELRPGTAACVAKA